MKALLALLAAAGGIILTACAIPKEPLAVEALFAGRQCGRVESGPVVTLIERQEQLDRFYDRLASLAPGPPRALRPDFRRQQAVLIEMGSRPTGGYGLAPVADSAVIRDGELEIMVDWQEPAPSMLQPQVLTSPCLLLRIPAGDYRRITVRDRQGQVRVEARK